MDDGYERPGEVDDERTQRRKDTGAGRSQSEPAQQEDGSEI